MASRRLAVYRWTEPNAGDVAVQVGLEASFGVDIEWVDIPLFEKTEIVIDQLASCDGLVVGGGTILGNLPTWLMRPEVLDRLDIPVCVFGTGIRDEGARRIRDEFIEPIRTLISLAEPFGVRGMMSRAFMKASGLDVRDVDVIGDPALAIQAEGNSTPVAGIAINVRPRPNGAEASTVTLLRRFLSTEFVQLAGPVRFFSCHDKWDVKAAEDLGVPIAPYLGLGALLRDLACASLVVSERLHGTVLSHVVGTPAIQLAYERKCFDYMSSMGEGDRCLDHPDVEELVEACSETIVNWPRVDARIQVFRERQREHAGRFLQRIAR